MAAKFIKYSLTESVFCFRLINQAGEQILKSECYQSNITRDQAIEVVKANSGYEERYERSSTPEGKWFFSLRSSDMSIVGTGMRYETQAEMERAISEVRSLAPNAIITEENDITFDRFHFY